MTTKRKAETVTEKFYEQDARLDMIETKLLCFEEYFTTIEQTLARIQQVFIAMQEGKL